MTVLHLQGTKLAEQKISKPMVKPFLISLGMLFLLAMHYFQHNPGGAGLELSFNITSWIPFSFAIAFGLLEICRQKTWRYSRLTLALFCCCTLLTIPALYSNAVGADVVNRLLGLWAGLLFFIGLQQFSFSQKQRQRMLWMILIAVWIQTLFGWYQFLWLEPGNAIGYNTIENRPYGIFQQPNVMASFLATGLVLSAYLLARIPMYRGKWSWQQLVLLLTPVITIPMLVILSSRTGWLGAVVGVGLMIPYLRRFAAKAQWRMWLLMIALGLSVSWSLNSSTGWAPKEERVSLESARSIHIPQAFRMFLKEPLTGYGYGTFEPAYITQTALWHQANPEQPYGLAALDHPHNELAYWASEGGIVPLAALLIAAAVVLFKIRKAREGTQLALVGLFFPITLHTQLEYPFYHSLAHWVIFIILIYWVDNLTAKYHKVQVNYVLTIRAVVLFLPIAVTSYMATALYSGYLLTKYETTQPVNVDYLLKVNNPWAWKNRFEWDLHLTQLQLGATTNNRELVGEYIQWATNKAVSWPRPALYQNLIAAYQYLGNQKQAEQIRQEAKFLFPNQDFASSQAIPALKESASRSEKNIDGQPKS
ncbi:Wzy polymerase domain-containing protein [Photobacterium sp. SDRW27]|uniref:PglL family O-oligosaccharyltransferase n=1 Tax=Photobacterium obscurum TaxID=2829490 RepID=UPI002243365D|nr:Wzy polymerase domain-containing protein [Photobacterium obscurum]MCW8330410.1 Wzy polymerase domain-containing protein [Photobacterium obscurum]